MTPHFPPTYPLEAQVADCLDYAAELIEGWGLAKGQYEDPETGSVCVVRALEYASGMRDHAPGDWTSEDPLAVDRNVLGQAAVALTKVLGTRPVLHAFDAIVTWSDRSDKDFITGTLHEAARQLDKGGIALRANTWFV